MANYTVVTRPIYKDCLTLASPERPCRSDILDGLDRLFACALASYSKILFVRFDLHYPSSGCHIAPDVAIGRFRDSFIKNRVREGYRPLYIWCLERDRSPYVHVHVVLLLDGQKSQSIYGHLATAREMWYGILGLPDADGEGGLLDRCDRECPGMFGNGIMIQASDPNRNNELTEAFRWATYLAKTEGKGRCPENTREWGCSQV